MDKQFLGPFLLLFFFFLHHHYSLGSYSEQLRINSGKEEKRGRGTGKRKGKKNEWKYDTLLTPLKDGEEVITVDHDDYSKDWPDGPNHTMLREFHPDTGVAYRYYSTKEDGGKLSVLSQFSSRLARPHYFLSLEGIYGHQILSTSYFWIEGIVSYTFARFREISANKASLAAIPDRGKMKVFSLGVGPSLRFHFLNALFENLKVFETLSTYFMYHTLTEEHYNRDYMGPGLRTDFGIHRRLGSKYLIGLRFSYQVAYVKRDADHLTQPTRLRSLNLSWISWGLELGIFF